MFGTKLKIKSVKLIFEGLVGTVDLFDLTFKTVIEVETSNLAPFEWMSTVSAVKTEQELAVLATTSVFRLFKISETLAARHWTPPDVFHLRDGEL